MSTPKTTLFVAPPVAPEAMPARCGGVFFGVHIPRDIPVFDARLRDEHPSPPRLHWERRLAGRGSRRLGDDSHIDRRRRQTQRGPSQYGASTGDDLTCAGQEGLQTPLLR